MAIASFAGKEFSVSPTRIYPFTDLSASGSISTESQEREGKKPATYVKGLGLENFSISIPLIAQNKVNIRDEYDSWKKIRDAVTPYFFILGGKPIIENKVLLQSVELSNTVFNSDKVITKGTIQLKFEEYAAKGSTSATTKASKTRTNVNVTNAILAGVDTSPSGH
jgi:hypothetical protein